MAGKTSLMGAVKMIADGLRQKGHRVTGCSFCSQHVAKKRTRCPYCGKTCKPKRKDSE